MELTYLESLMICISGIHENKYKYIIKSVNQRSILKSFERGKNIIRVRIVDRDDEGTMLLARCLELPICRDLFTFVAELLAI